jgi:peptide/nickel transport system substrate-binding protein
VNERNHLLSRRSLLKTASVGAAGLTGATLLSSTSLGSVAAAQETPATPKAGGTLTIGLGQKTSNSNMLFLRHFAGSENLYTRLLANARLITLDPERTNFVGALAESFEFSADTKTLTYKLRSGLTWHDDTPFTSEDVKFTYHMIGIPGVGTTLFGSLFNSIVVGMKEWIDGTADSISGLTTPDETTVVFELFENLNQFEVLQNFNQICIAPNHILNQYLNRDTGGAEVLQSEWATTKHIGIGPFKVIEYVADQYIRYAPFENYYNGKPLLDEVVYRPFLDAQTTAASLESQEVDVARIPPSEFERFSGLDFLNMHTAPFPGYSGTPFNARQPFFNKDVRQALIYALDRDAIAQTVFSGSTSVVHTPINMPVFGDSPTLTTYNYDPEKAKALLTSGGWDPNYTIRWALAELPSSEQDIAYYAAIFDFWSQVGVKADFQVVGTDTTQLWGPDWNFDLYPSTYPIGSPGAVAVHLDPKLASYVSSGYSEPEYDELWNKAGQQLSDDEAATVVHRLQDIISEQALTLMVVRGPDIWGINKRVHGLTPNYFPYETDLYDWQLEKVWVE